MRISSTTTVATKMERLREKIRSDSQEITRLILEAANNNLGNEARFRTLFAQIIEPWAKNLSIPLIVQEERTLATGRADATYNRMIIEYEAPGRLRESVTHGPTAHAIKQAKDYVEGVAAQENQKEERLLGVALDGFYFIYVRKVAGHWTDPEVEPVNDKSVARFLRLLVSLTSGKAMIPENLVKDFGSQTLRAQRVASALYNSLCSVLDSDKPGIVGKIYEQWKTFYAQVSGYEEGSSKLNRKELSRFSKGMGVRVDAVKPARLLFTVHTYFALLIKLISYYSMSRFVSAFGTRFGSLYQLDNTALKNEMDELERGGLFRTLGIRNFLEGDFFKWYLFAWDENIANAVRIVLEHLKDYDPGTLEVSPEHARDLLKKLYHRLMPREIRHDLGEYYTPDWLAEHVLNELGYTGQIDKRLLDPACGSGTFLILAIKRLKERCFKEGLNEQETLDTILNNIVGIDLNPLAVISARTNYMLALGDLLEYRNREIDIPVYLADSILIPSSGSNLFLHDRYEISTVVGLLEIPSAIKTKEQISILCNLLEECVSTDVGVSVFLNRAKTSLNIDEDQWEGRAEKVLGGLFKKLLSLHHDGLDGIWAKIIQNAFMPMFLGQFDFIAGNPPWIGWEALPEDYRRKTLPIWQAHGLFPHGGMDTILGKGKKDLSMLMSFTVTKHLLKNQGRLGFLITQSVFKTAGAGDGFRKFRTGSGSDDNVSVIIVNDFSDFQAFEEASTRTCSFVWEKGRKNNYPVKYTLWQKTAYQKSIGQDSSLVEVEMMTRRLEMQAIPVNPAYYSPWLTAYPKASQSIKTLLNQSSTKARAGVYSGGSNGIYWIEVLQNRPDGVLVVRNITEGTKKVVESVNADLEPDLIYPLLRGTEVKRWIANSSAYIILAQDPFTRKGIDEREMQIKYPKTYGYLKHFEQSLRKRAAFKRYYTRRSGRKIIDTAPFYSMFNVGEYTLSTFKVVWHRMIAPIGAVVVGSKDGKPILPQETHAFVATESQEEAFYLAGMLNSLPFNFAAMAYSQAGGKSFGSPHILENLHVPKFDKNDKTIIAISELAKDIQSNIGSLNKEALQIKERELDEAASQLWGISTAELDEIRSSYYQLTKSDLREAREERQAEEREKLIAINNQVLAELEEYGEMSLAEIEAAVEFESTIISNSLSELLDQGKIQKVGKGKGTRYCLVDGGE